jgi:hypothetical protein
MLTRIRLEAEGATLAEVQADLNAAHDMIVQNLPPGIARVTDNVFARLDEDEGPVKGQAWFRGRLVFAFPIDTSHAVSGEALAGRELREVPEGAVPGYTGVLGESPDERVARQLRGMGETD